MSLKIAKKSQSGTGQKVQVVVVVPEGGGGGGGGEEGGCVPEHLEM